jgi:predicted deacylase
MPFNTFFTATPYPTYTPTPTLLAQTGLAPSSTPWPSSTAAPSPIPALASGLPTVIGYTVLKKPLEVYTFGSGANERMIVAGIHGGNEYNTIQLAYKLIRYLSDHPEKIPARVKLYILPSLNPDGEMRSHDMYGRANQNGVDLNHNWPAFWKTNWSRNGCWTYLHLTGGSAPASEPETQALMSFLISHHVQALISYHSAALGIFPGGIPPDSKSQNLAEAVAKVSDYSYPPIETGCDMSGALVDWASAQGIASLDIELTDHRHTDYQQNLNILDVLLNWKP